MQTETDIVAGMGGLGEIGGLSLVGSRQSSGACGSFAVCRSPFVTRRSLFADRSSPFASAVRFSLFAGEAGGRAKLAPRIRLLPVNE